MRDADQGGCVQRAKVATVERRRVGHTEQEQFAGFKATALLPGWQRPTPAVGRQHGGRRHAVDADNAASDAHLLRRDGDHALESRSEEHTSEPQSLMRNSYAVYCSKKHQNTTTSIYVLKCIDKHQE